MAIDIRTSGARAATRPPGSMTVRDQTPVCEAFEKGVLAGNVQLDRNGQSVVLYDLTLAEDDGPGACSVVEHGPAAPTSICGLRQVKKILHLDRGAVSSAHLTLCVFPLPGEKAPLKAVVNGRAFTYHLDRTVGPDEWPTIRIPAALLRQGDNEVVLSCSGDAGWRITVAQRHLILRNDPARRDRPGRSFRSADGGRTWAAGLGDDGSQDGEFMIRLHLGQHAAAGELIGPVIDLAALAAGGALAADVSVSSMRALARKRIRRGTRIELSLRSGDGPVYDPKIWGGWMPCSPRGSVKGELRRFVQWRAVLTTINPKATPVLDAVEVEARVVPRPHDWARNLTLADSHNEEILYTSMPFEYEKFDEPQLVELRRQYKLDDVVAGAQSELEKMIRLRNWVSAQWKYDPPIPYYPAWDAREIIPLRRGFCVQYAIVYMQCALSLGMQTRFVFGYFPNVWVKGNWVCGHEVNEYWSNDLGKWVMMDAHQDECFVDSRTGVLTDMLELHEDQLDTYLPGGIDGSRVPLDEERPSEGVLRWKGADPTPRPEKPKLDVKWGYLHWMPRNNFYAHRFPEPLYQGRTWTWTGYWLWQDGRTPRQPKYRCYTRRRSDIEWTINQVRWAAASTDREGTVRIALGTVTPDFDTYLISVDGGEWRHCGDSFDWDLQQGKNRIEMRVRNRAGVLGRRSWIELDYA
jgi:hypothetical protein